jgi:hypothetical protein
MPRKAGWVSCGLILAVLTTLSSISLGAGPAEAAVVYCKTVGVPKGCVVRPAEPVAAVGVVAAPVVDAGAPGVGVRPGTPMNRGGPVDRVGRR